MLNTRRTRKAILALEALDDRIVPSAMSVHMAARPGTGRLAMLHQRQAEARMDLREAMAARVEAREAARSALVARLHPPKLAMNVTPNMNPRMNVQVSSPTLQHFAKPSQVAINNSMAIASTGNAGKASSGQPASSSSSSPGSNVTTNNQGGGSTNAQTSLPANVDQNLNQIYQEFLSSGSSSSFTSSEATIIFIDGSNVGINAHGNGTGDFTAFVSALTGLGMQVQASDANSETVSGMIPISALPSAATLSQTFSISPMYKPILS